MGALKESSEKGKYSLEGRPPPSDMIPGVARNLAAPLSELPLRPRDSLLSRSGVALIVSRSALKWADHFLHPQFSFVECCKLTKTEKAEVFWCMS